jgi:hypothetical protein
MVAAASIAQTNTKNKNLKFEFEFLLHKTINVEAWRRKKLLWNEKIDDVVSHASK